MPSSYRMHSPKSPKRPQGSHGSASPRRTGRRVFPLAPIAYCLVAAAILLYTDSSLLHWQTLWSDLAKPLGRMLLLLAVGLAMGLLIEGSGWAVHMARLVRPLTHWGRLESTAGAAFITAFLSGTAANTMLMEALRGGHICPRALRCAYLINTGLPVFLLHLPTTFFVILPMTHTAGGIYLLLNGIAALLRTLLLLSWSRMITPAVHSQPAPQPPTKKRMDMNRIATLFYKRFTRILLFSAPVYILLHLLTQAGFFNTMRLALADGLASSIFPVEAAGVVIFAMATEFTSGIAAAAALLDAGTLSVKQTVMALVLGTIAATPIRALRHQLPSHAGIFTPKLGLFLLLQSQALRIASLALVTGCYVLLF